MAKQILSHDELLRRVRAVLKAHDACGRVRLDGLETGDDTSAVANWHVSWVRASGSESEVRACELRVREEIEALREAFDCETQDPPGPARQPPLW